MATKKKSAVKAKVAAPKAAAAKGGAKGAVPAAKKGKGGLWVTLALVAVLAGFAGQAYWVALQQAKLKFDFVRVGSIIAQGQADGQFAGPWFICGDASGNLFAVDGPADNQRLQKFNDQYAFVGRYKASTGQQALFSNIDFTVDETGVVYFLRGDGTVTVLSNDLKYLRTLSLNVPAATAIAADKGRLFVAARNDSKIMVFDTAGSKITEFGAPGTKTGDLANPIRMTMTGDGNLVVMEDLPEAFRIKVFSPEQKLLSQFRVKDINMGMPVRMAADNRGLLYINDHLGSKGVAIFRLSNGKIFGEVKGTTDGVLFPTPGTIAANRFTGVIYVHSLPGMIPCTLSQETK